jgi:hypothetical protein
MEQGRHSCVQPPTWRTRSLYLRSQGQGGPVIPTGTRFSLRRHLRLAVLRESSQLRPRFFSMSLLGKMQIFWVEDAGSMFIRNVIKFKQQEPWLHARRAKARVSLTPPERVRLRHLVCGHQWLRLFLNGSMYLHLQDYSHGVMTQKTTLYTYKASRFVG